MNSKVLDGSWRLEEGVYKASFMRDMLTKSSVHNNYDLYNGRQLKGKVMTIRFSNGDSDYATMLFVEVGSSVST